MIRFIKKLFKKNIKVVVKEIIEKEESFIIAITVIYNEIEFFYQDCRLGIIPIKKGYFKIVKFEDDLKDWDKCYLLAQFPILYSAIFHIGREKRLVRYEKINGELKLI